MVKRSDINVAAAAGLSVYLPLYWVSTPDGSGGAPNPMTAGKAFLLLSVLAVYLLVPFVLGLLSRYPLAARTPSWLCASAGGSAILVLGGVVAIMRQLVTVEETVIAWLLLTLWTMPASAGVYYFGAAVRSVRAWNRGSELADLGLRK